MTIPPQLEKLRQNQESKSSLGYTSSLRVAWGMWMRSCLKKFFLICNSFFHLEIHLIYLCICNKVLLSCPDWTGISGLEEFSCSTLSSKWFTISDSAICFKSLSVSLPSLSISNDSIISHSREEFLLILSSLLWEFLISLGLWFCNQSHWDSHSLNPPEGGSNCGFYGARQE